MTIPKSAGLSRLADVSNEQALTFHYPVKKRGEKRRLRPNLDAIRYLEIEAETDTEIESVNQLGNTEEWAEMYGVRALGWYSAKRAGHYPRRMFDVFALETSSSNSVSYTPCAACDDFSRSWACADHPEVKWDTARRCWVRPGTPVWYELHPEDRPPTPAEEIVQPQGMQPPTGLYDRMIEMFAGPLPSPGFTVRQADQEAYRRQAALYSAELRIDPNQGRPGYHYHFPTDRWVPDTDDALGDFRDGGEVGAGFFQGRPVTVNEVSADERMAAEWERQNGIPLAEALRQIDRIPDELMGPTRRDFLGALPDFSVTLTGTFTLEITGDTTEDSASTFRIEVERNDGTS